MSNGTDEAGGGTDSGVDEDITCPQCGASDVILQQKKGSALCRSMYLCSECGEPFEDFS